MSALLHAIKDQNLLVILFPDSITGADNIIFFDNYNCTLGNFFFLPCIMTQNHLVNQKPEQKKKKMMSVRTAPKCSGLFNPA